jgi:RNA polymerase sigma factor (sigma-70 family)
VPLVEVRFREFGQRQRMEVGNLRIEGDRFNRLEVSNDCFDQSGYRQFTEAAADMPTNDLPDDPRQPSVWRFASTRWSMVAAAGRKESAEARAALAELCQTYWYPLYAYARGRLARPDDAQDLTQDFFAQLLEKDYLQDADPRRGKFRSFLLTAFQRFLAKEHARSTAQKRGGHRRPLSLEFQHGEHRYRHEPADLTTPETLYERRWALTLLEQALARLRQEFTASGKERLFEALKGTLTGDGTDEPYERIGRDLGLSESAIKTAAHRMRRRFRELLRAEVAQTVAAPEEVEDELRDLFAAVRREKSQADR